MNEAKQTNQTVFGSGFGVGLLTIVPLLCVYIGAYLLLHESRPTFPSTPTGHAVRVPHHAYRVGDGYINWMFWPAEKLHERADPEAWTVSNRPRRNIANSTAPDISWPVIELYQHNMPSAEQVAMVTLRSQVSHATFGPGSACVHSAAQMQWYQRNRVRVGIGTHKALGVRKLAN